LNCKIVSEDPNEYTFASSMFADPLRWTFTNQIQFLVKKLSLQMDASQTDSSLIQEMDAHSTFLTWTPVLRDLGHLTQQEYSLIVETFNLIIQNKNVSIPNAYIVISASPEVALQRIRLRSREYEATKFNQTADLVGRLDKSISKFLKKVHQPILVLQTDQLDLVNSLSHKEHLVETVKEFMNSNSIC
jgi:deoxyadenosine/deoxycytidine kinase